MIVSILLISFLMDGIVSNYVHLNGFLVPLFSLIGLIVSYDFFTLDREEFYKYAFILGLCYDLIYTDTFVFYAFLFSLMAFIIIQISKVLTNNYFGLIVLSLICIIIFRSVTYLLLVITGNVIFDINILFKGIYNSILINIIYGIIVKFICDRIISYKKKKRKFY